MEFRQPNDDVEASRGLAKQLTTLNQLEDSLETKIENEIAALRGPDAKTMQRLGQLSWKELWVDTPQKELLAQARQRGPIPEHLTEVIAAYPEVGDSPEGQELIDRMSDKNPAKIEAICRFGMIMIDDADGTPHPQLHSDYRRRVINIINGYTTEFHKYNGSLRLAARSRDPRDLELCMQYANSSASTPLGLAGNLLTIASLGYEPALAAAKEILTDIVVLNASHQTSAPDDREDHDRLLAQAATTSSLFKNLEITRIENVAPVQPNPEVDKEFEGLIQKPEVVALLEKGVHIKRALSPMERSIVDSWHSVIGNSVFQTRERLWEYASQKISDYILALKMNRTPDFPTLLSEVTERDYSYLANIVKTEVPTTHFDADLFIEEAMEAHRSGRRARLDGEIGHVRLSRGQISAEKQRIEKRDAETRQKVDQAFTTINLSLLHRALYYHVTGDEQVDTFI